MRVEAQKTITKDVTEDSFIHFTTEERAEQILSEGKLLFNPPYEKYGIDAVTAISTTYGTLVDAVQLNHIDGDPVAILFTTHTVPDIGYIEEVIWHEDVILDTADIISVGAAISMLSKTDPIDEYDILMYKEIEESP